MPTRNLEKLFYPGAVAVIGASNRDGLPGHAVMHNLLQGGFEGPIMPVTASERAIAGVLSYPRVDALPVAPDLALICDHNQATPELIRDLRAKGARVAILVAEDLSAPHNGAGAAERRLIEEARRCDLRLLGPSCLGVMVPGIGLNASIADAPALPGGIAFVSQSATIGLGVLDWARERDIGFSYFISLGTGSGVDVDVADVIDYLGNDAMTRAILLYVEEISNGRAFLSASRGASRNKPILVIKSGRTAEGRAATFGGERADGLDAVYDAAFRRAGMLRVHGFGELFAAVETLGRSKPLKAERLAVLANGRGMAALAVDKLLVEGGRLAPLAAETTEALQALLPAGWPAVNPLIIDGEAPPERYGEAAKVLLADRQVDALMVLHAPVPSVSATEAARAVIAAVRAARRPALTSWMGGARVAEARRRFAEAGIPTFDTATRAVEAFMHMARFHRNQAMLIETPPSMPVEFTPATERARRIIGQALGRGESLLLDAEARSVLEAYGLPAYRPPRADAAARGVLPGAQLVRIGVAEDPVFGPFITFGHGGPGVASIDDLAYGLPPLNMSLARELIGRTRVERLLTTLGPGAAAAVDRLSLALVQVSQMIVELPEIKRLEIGPIVVDDAGIGVAGAWLRVGPAAPDPQQRLAIRPYPGELEEWFTLRNGRRVLLRPIRPEDEPAHYDFLSKVSAEDMRLRFFHVVRTLPHAEMARLTQIDYDREMAVIATAEREDGDGFETLGVVRIVTDVDNERAEYAILIRSDLKGQGLGHKLMTKIIDYCRSRGTRKVIGLILCDNKRMLDMVHALGFTTRRLPDDDVMEATLDLAAAAPAEDDAIAKLRAALPAYSHSMVPGGLEVTS